jgi:hypothetical protein
MSPHRIQRSVAKKIILLGCGLQACTGGEEELSYQLIDVPCTPDQGSPYTSGIPYLGIHADAGNSDVIHCESAENYVESWYSLKGLGMTQPNTFSPSGDVLYATTSNPEPEGCRVHALDAESGAVQWCRSYPPSVSLGAVEVDSDGSLYFTTEGWLHSLTPDGEDRWSLELVDHEGVIDQPWGVHFTPDGHIATVTSTGEVYLVGRDTGEVLSSLSVPDTYGFVTPAGLDLGIDLSVLLPDGVNESIETLWGSQDGDEQSDGFATLLGSGAFSDNTVGIAETGEIYVIGGGLDEESGALVQIRVEGSVDAPVLEAGWYTPTQGGSATSPSISQGGQYVVISDGAGSDTLLSPEDIDAWVKVMDIPACDANTDSDPDPEVCGVSYQQPIEREPMIGAPAIDSEGTVIFWELALSFSHGPEERDVGAFGPDGMIWETALPDDMDWASVITVTDNHLIGTASTITPSDQSLLSLNFPSVTDDYIVVLDRSNGELVWKGDLHDDGAATVTIGPDGALYAAIYGLLSMLAVDELPDPGLVRFSPIEEL